LEGLAEHRKPRIARVIGAKAQVKVKGIEAEIVAFIAATSKNNKNEAARVGVPGLADEPDHHCPSNALERLGEDEFPLPAAGVERRVFCS
jgi:hypothetical protein